MNNNKMLIVDGDSVQARALTRSLRLRHFDAVSVRDAAAALAEAADTLPDYAVVEQQLGDASGLALIRRLKDINPRMRVLVLTAYASVDNAVRAVKLGAWNYMAKPAYVEEILTAFGIDPAAVVADLKTPVAEKTHSLDDFEWKHILRALNDHDGNVSAAARALRMNRRTLQRKLESRQGRAGKDIVAEIRSSGQRQRRAELRQAYAAARLMRPAGAA